MTISYSDIVLPNNPELGPMLTAQGQLTVAAKPCSSGELAFAALGKAIVENGRRIDPMHREALVRLLLAV